MAMFGRDSLITSYQALPFTPELATTTLVMLASFQGMTRDDFRDEEPGKILHELRWGEMTAFEERPHSPYYGSADSTPLFLILLDEYERWTGDRATVRAAGVRGPRRPRSGSTGTATATGTATSSTSGGTPRPASRTSAGRTPGIRSGTPMAGSPSCPGRPARSRATSTTPSGAARGWRGRSGTTPTCRPAGGRSAAAQAPLQSRLLDRRPRLLRARAGRRQAEGRLPHLEHRPPALERHRRRRTRSAACVRHLMGERLFSGWGVRTMAEGDAAYNPIGYHVGTIWPHDNSLIAWGLRRYGYREEAAGIALAHPGSRRLLRRPPA